ncbi:MAG: lamin tail domain-containing protein [Tannerellaceae bacterium]|jgi:hypothetical protein|nr:lamin tail domain-containing protein [Tannerellaceae bacterium]
MKQLLLLWALLLPVHLFSQSNESISGKDIADASLWEGDTARFLILASGQLQFSSPPGEAGSASLRVPVTFGANMTWEMDVKLNFKSTDANNLRICVYASDRDTFYIQAGNNTRRVSLYEKDAGGNTKLRIAGRKDLLAEPYAFVSVRLTLEEGKRWTLHTRREGEQEFCEEGSFDMLLPSAAPEALLMIVCRYVKARTGEYVIDNLRVTRSITGLPEPAPEPEDPAPLPEDPAPEPEDPVTEEETPPSSPGKPGQVTVSEVMADPKGSAALPETEYVELYNVSGAPVSLRGWAFVYDGKKVVLDMLLLPPGGYAVLYREGRTVHVDEPGQAVPLALFPAALANTGKLLQLEDAAGTLIDSFAYPKARPGVSWERLGDEVYLSADARGGTPGSPNSSPQKTEEPEEVLPEAEPGDIVFNELLLNPLDGGSEYVELYNRSAHRLPLHRLSLSVRKQDGSPGTPYPLAELTTSIEAGGYALLTKRREGVASFYLLSSPDAVHELRIPALNNTSATVTLSRTEDGAVIDEVAYSSQWHESPERNRKGVALERISPDAETQDAANWTSAAATAGYGTPGYRNSQFGAVGSSPTAGISPPALKEDGLYHIEWHTAKPGYRCRIRIYNIAGMQVAEVANHALTGTSGEFLWDGRTSAGSRLKVGIYLFFVELYHANGQTKSEKNVFLVR